MHLIELERIDKSQDYISHSRTYRNTFHIQTSSESEFKMRQLAIVAKIQTSLLMFPARTLGARKQVDHA